MADVTITVPEAKWNLVTAIHVIWKDLRLAKLQELLTNPELTPQQIQAIQDQITLIENETTKKWLWVEFKARMLQIEEMRIRQIQEPLAKQMVKDAVAARLAELTGL